ncbi:MAG: Uma2 family endonuclease [Deltaproteobacteria bacterium]|nr:Uma2 family endonuclease [Deltaproteobacteria bacterium]
MRRATVSNVHEHTFADYLRLEKDSNVKHEFLDGEIYAMTGGTPKHAELAVVISSLLHTQLRGRGYHVFSSDLRVRVPATGLAAYPDVTVVYGELAFDPEDDDTVTNPRVVVEVLSPSTEKFDRGLKSHHYQQIPTLEAVVLVAQREPQIEVCSRRDDGAWTIRASGPGEIATLDSIGCTLPVDEVYR